MLYGRAYVCQYIILQKEGMCYSEVTEWNGEGAVPYKLIFLINIIGSRGFLMLIYSSEYCIIIVFVV